MTYDPIQMAAETKKAMDDRSDRVKLLAKHVATALAALDPEILEIFLPYSGCGDSGCTDNLIVVHGETAKTELAPPKVTNCVTEGGITIENAMDEIFCLAEELHFEGWENNNGGSGTVIVDVKSGTAKVEHSWIVETTDDETFDFAPSEPPSPTNSNT